MKPPKSDSLNQPFEGLGALLKKKSVRLEPSPRPPAKPPAGPPAPVPPATQSEAELFAAAMAGVQRLELDLPEPECGRLPATAAGDAAEKDAVDSLQRLVDSGTGFRVSATPEYMEGVGYLAPPEITTRLHRGDFAVQAFLDLHGCIVEQACEAFDAFMREAVRTGKRTVLIIHGRGLSSPAEPVLKAKVAQWLTSGEWRKWVVAFTSARMCDGGSGASYVLLRQRPLTKRFRKKRSGGRCQPAG